MEKYGKNRPKPLVPVGFFLFDPARQVALPAFRHGPLFLKLKAAAEHRGLGGPFGGLEKVGASTFFFFFLVF